MNIVPVIISEGSGAQVWPLSREAFPHPFVRLPDGDTLIRKTFRCAASLHGVKRVVTVTDREFGFLTADEYELVASPGIYESHVLTPAAGGTAAAVGIACRHVAQVEGDDAVILVLPADHIIQDQEAFSAAVERAAKIAHEGRFVAIASSSGRPGAGDSYIEVDGERVVRFVETPEPGETAGRAGFGTIIRNCGIFCFTAGAMLDCIGRLSPELCSQMQAALESAQVSSSAGRLVVEVNDKVLTEAAAPMSIDRVIAERLQDAACVQGDFGCSRIGSWDTMASLTPADKDGNRVSGNVMLEGTEGTFVRGDDRLISILGVSDLLVVDTADALLICAKDAAHDIERIYNKLRDAQSESAMLHRTAHRPWGTYTVLEEGDRFKIKRIEVKPGASLSLQAHHHRSEHWVVVRGTARVTNGCDVSLLTTNQSTYIPCGNRHRLENPGKLPLIMIEVQSGEYLGEDDIVRFDDIYGRLKRTEAQASSHERRGEDSAREIVMSEGPHGRKDHTGW
ncbi:MAG: mannose-1-phosphate guanylyltransferase/mannose-6-phosphate isomerase [Rhizobiaceae bacterium]|nr:mannose-1-phosphate guanylyltransferase/mannose-6-phosphate isomerase [Rhizobiaceae bacterium]